MLHSWVLPLPQMTVAFKGRNINISLVFVSECPLGWHQYESTRSCFQVNKKTLSWSEAERECNQEGGHLASIVDEFENVQVFDIVKQANLSVLTVWLGRLVKLSETGEYEWNDGSVGRHSEGFKGGEPLSAKFYFDSPPSGTNKCLTMWLDSGRAEGSWLEWSCTYRPGYASLCKKPYKSVPSSAPSIHQSSRCCVTARCTTKCPPRQRCIPDDLNCWTKYCPDNGPGWCLPNP
ncbi:unnamed protein product [Enterobius vermicularis]|uniref:C-type lectin domain-containing protein n=1 Tax=Enterobius vermicularis TaxID=51028 RepID=A0A0N4VLJ3_ENTVE|nr:unnamed protein product [Enterobius vermicularis]